MKKLSLTILALMLLLTFSACKAEPEPAESTTAPPAQTTAETTQAPLPYWDTHELKSYAGYYNGRRFSGDFNISIEGPADNGDVNFRYPGIRGMSERSDDASTAEEMYDNRFSSDFLYDKANRRYINMGILEFRNGQFHSRHNEIGYIYYSDSSPSYRDKYYNKGYDSDGEYLVYFELPDANITSTTLIFWKKGVGLLGYYFYHPNTAYGVKEVNVRLTYKGAEGWDMAKTLVPTPLPGSERKWPDKLWPTEYRGLDDPELRAILEEY